MRQPYLAVALLVVVPFAGCKPKPAPQIPTPPPAAPATPPPAPQPPAETVPIEDEYTRLKNMDSAAIEQMGLLADIHFDYDRADLRDQDRSILSQNADTLKKFDFLRITVEGHCDERGSVEYNLALGERRAKAALDYLVSLGVDPGRMKMVSYGKEVPLCQESNEDCWARNRRAHFAITGKAAR